MKNRVVVIFDGGTLPDKEELRLYEKKFDELIFVVLWRTFREVTMKAWHPGNILAETRNYLFSVLERPFYLLPLDGQSLSPQQLMIRLTHLVPRFSSCSVVDGEWRMTAQLMGYKGEDLSTFQMARVANYDAVDRAIYVTRAQPFHNGHAEFIDHILANHEEAILAIACAEQALTVHNPASAGERMEMVSAYIHPRFSKRVWVVPFSHTPYMMEKFKAIKWLMPHFSHLYGSNPAHLLMGETEGLSTHLPDMACPVRATMVRDEIISGHSIHGMVPIETEEKIYELAIDQRIQFLNRN